jgi:hypothetical protein
MKIYGSDLVELNDAGAKVRGYAHRVLISKAILTTSIATVEFTQLLKHEFYEIELSGIRAGEDKELRMRTDFDPAGGSFDVGVSDYGHSLTGRSTSATAYRDATQAWMALTGDVAAETLGLGASPLETYSARIYILNMGNATDEFMCYTSAVSIGSAGVVVSSQWGGGQRNSVGRVGAIQILPEDGNFSGGEIRIYGWETV